MVSDVSVHDHLVPLLCAFGEAKHHGGEQVVKQTCLLNAGQEGERQMRKDLGTQYELPEHTSYSIFSTTPKTSISFQIYQWINPLMRLEVLIHELLPKSPTSEYCCIGD